VDLSTHLYSYHNADHADCDAHTDPTYTDRDDDDNAYDYNHGHNHLYPNLDGDILYANTYHDSHLYDHPLAAYPDIYINLYFYIYLYPCPAYGNAHRHNRPTVCNTDGNSHTLIDEGADV
jgi:hypothetical protein